MNKVQQTPRSNYFEHPLQLHSHCSLWVLVRVCWQVSGDILVCILAQNPSSAFSSSGAESLELVPKADDFLSTKHEHMQCSCFTSVHCFVCAPGLWSATLSTCTVEPQTMIQHWFELHPSPWWCVPLLCEIFQMLIIISKGSLRKQYLPKCIEGAILGAAFIQFQLPETFWSL